MNLERADILNRLAAGQISTDEAARLLREPVRPPSPPLEGSERRNTGLAGRRLHVRVTDLGTGQPKVNVNLPLSWVEVGMKIGARYRPEIADFDVNALIEQIRDGTQGKLVEVEDLDDNERVEIFLD